MNGKLYNFVNKKRNNGILNRKYEFDDLFKILILLLGAIFFFRLVVPVFGMISVCFALTFVIELILLYFSLEEKNSHSITVICILLLTFLASLYKTSSFSFSYFKQLVFFSDTVIILFISSNHKLTMSSYKWCDYVITSIGIMFVFCYLVYPHKYLAGGILLNYGNPNETGLWIFNIAIFIVITLFNHNQNKWYLYLKIFLVPLLLYLIIETRSRTALGAFLLFCIMLLPCVFKQYHRISWGISLFFTAIPIIFGVLYMTMISSDFILNLFSFLVSTGKTLTSRSDVWSEAIELIFKSPLFGNYNELLVGDYMAHMHNAYFDTAARYGLPVLVLVMVFIYNILDKFSRNEVDNLRYASICAFYATLAFCCFESALFFGSTGLPIICSVYLLVANSERNMDLLKKENYEE